MRLFVASLLSPDRQAFYDQVLEDLLRTHGDVLRPIPPASAHVTYAFLGQVDERSLANLTEAVKATTGGRGAIDASLGPPAVLLSGSEARLVYAPVTSGAAELTRLSTDVVAALRQALPGVEISGMKSAHVTLARFRNGTRRASARPVVEALARTARTLTAPPDQIRHVQVLSSDLTPSGAVYTVRTEVNLEIR